MGKLIALDNGHGLNTPGKRTPIFTDGTKSPYTGLNFMHEWEFNRRVVQLLKVELERCGFRTIEVSPTEADTDLMVRCKTANAMGADFFLSVHANAMGDGWSTSGKGIETLTYGRGESLTVGKILQKSLVAATGLADRGMKDGAWLAVVKYTKMAAALVECGFMDNPDEAPKLLSEAYRKTVAVALAKGLCEAYGTAYVPDGQIAVRKVEPVYETYAGTKAATLTLAPGTYRLGLAYAPGKKVSELVKQYGADFGTNFGFIEKQYLIGNNFDHGTKFSEAYGDITEWFSFAFKDGKPMIGLLDPNDTYDMITQAKPPLVEKGNPCWDYYRVKQNVPDDIGKDPAQRTIYTIDKAGNLVITVSDGREGGTGHSPGWTLAEATEFVLAKGAWDSLNGDGGSSSVLADKSGSLMQNKGAFERAVNHAVLIFLLPPDEQKPAYYRMGTSDANKIIALLKAAYAIIPSVKLGRLADELRKASGQKPDNGPDTGSFTLLAKADANLAIGLLKAVYSIVPDREVGRIGDEIRKASGQPTENT